MWIVWLAVVAPAPAQEAAEDEEVEEIVVYGEEPAEEAAKTLLTPEEIRRIPGAFGDPVRAIQSLPSVARPATVEGDIVVRGSEGLNTGTYIDEIPVPYLFHFFVGRSVVNPGLLDDLEFYPGGMPSRYGDVTQAVVDARTLDGPTEPGLRWSGTVDLMDASFAAEGRIDETWSLQGAFRVSWIGALIGIGAGIYARIEGLQGYRPGYPTIAYRDHTLRAAWERGEDRLTATWLSAADAILFHPERYDDDGDGEWDPPEPRVEPWDPSRILDQSFERISLRWDHTGQVEHTTWVAFGPEHEISLLEGVATISDGVEQGRIDGFLLDVTHRQRFEVDDDTVLQVGADGWVNPSKVQDYKGWQGPGTEVPIYEDLRASAGAWVEVHEQVGPVWIAPGLRFGQHAFRGKGWSSAEPRLTVRRTFGDRWTAIGFLGRFAQVPPIDRYASGLSGDPDLSLMTATQASLGVEGRWPSGLQVDLTVYASRTDDMVVKDLKVTLDRVLGGEDAQQFSEQVVPVYSGTTGVAFGAEALVRLRPRNGFWGWAAVSAGRALRQGPDRAWDRGDYDLPISVTLLAARELPARMHLSARLQVTSGYPYTPLHGSFDASRDDWDGLTGEPNSARFPVFRQLDLRWEKGFGKRDDWAFYVEARNATNAKNPILATYDAIYDDFLTQAWIPILPNLGLEVRH